jgi:long-subunit fatty acid transport protein
MRRCNTDILLFPFLVAAAAALAAPAARAGFEYGVQGAETVARSGANSARTTGPEALYLNVAGIAAGDGLEFLIDANFLNAALEADLYGNRVDGWSPAGVTDVIDYPLVHNSTDIYAGGFKMFPAPFAGVTFPIPQWKKLSLGFGVFGPAALGDFQFPKMMTVEYGGSSYELPGPQRYDLIYEKVLFMWPTIAAAYRLSERFSLGLAFQWGVLHLKFTQAVNNGSVTTPGSYRNDMLATFDGWDAFIPAGMVGLRWTPLDRLEMGFSARFSGGIKAKWDMIVVAAPYGDDPIYSNDPTLTWMDEDPYSRPKGTLQFRWPASIYRLGFRYKHPNPKAPVGKGRPLYPWESELFDVEADLFVEANHVLESMKMKVDGTIPIGRAVGEVAPFKPQSGGVITLRRNWRDALSVRVGGSVNLLKGHLSILWGAFYETPTTEEEDIRLDYMTTDKWGLSLGLQGRLYAIPVRKKQLGLQMSLSYLHVFYPAKKVTDGKIEHVSSTLDSGTVVNNGYYKFALDVLTAGIRITVL